MRLDLRFPTGLLLGLALGCVIGIWVLRPEPGGTAPDSSPRTANADAGSVPESEANTAAIRVEGQAVLRGAQKDAQEAEGTSPDPKRLAEALRLAHGAGDWRAFLQALEALGAAGTLQADRILVQTLGDRSIAFLEPIADEYRRWLAGTEVEGVAAAVRERIAADVEAHGISEKEAARAWANLFAEHTTPDGMLWIREVLGDGDPYWYAWTAFAEAARPQTVDLAREILSQPYDPSNPGHFGTSSQVKGALTALVRADPEEGMGILEEEMTRPHTGARVRVGTEPLIILYLKSIPSSRLAQGAEWVRDTLERGAAREGVPDVRAAFRASAILAKRGHVGQEFRSFVAWPSSTLKGIAARGGPADAERVLWRRARGYLLSHDELASKEAVEALEAAMPYIEQGSSRQRVRERVAGMRVLLQWWDIR